MVTKNAVFMRSVAFRKRLKDIIIEGVETEEQEQFLKEGGFTCGQGYLCNCPVPIGDFEKMYL